MTETRVARKARQVHTLDEVTQDLLKSIRKNDNRFRMWFLVSWTVLLIVGVFGIYHQNQIASANQKHIDCIVKLFTTPLPPEARSRVIVNPATTCDIKGQN